MSRSSRLIVLLIIILFNKVFSMNLDSIPIWNPEILVKQKLVSDEVFEQSKYSSNLETHGYKTMQITVGDGGTQVDQELRLSIQGMIRDSIFIDAFLNDVDRKAGNQTTATLQEVDKVYFRVESKHGLIHLGDFTWKDDNMGLYSFERSTLGGKLGLRSGYSEVQGAIGTDEISRRVLVINGVNGQREGYSISGDGYYLSIVPNSETIWINGVKLVRDKDYMINYAGGLLDFKGKYFPSIDDEIRIEYDAYENENIFNLYAAKGKYRHPNIFLDVSFFRLENDKNRLKRNIWTDKDYITLKNDKGGELFQSRDSLYLGGDSLLSLNRPKKDERYGTRIRLQKDKRYYLDAEIALNKRDSNTVSSNISGPEGHAYRWFLTTDSTENMKTFPISFSVYGNYIEKGFNINEYEGNDNDWNSYKLRDEWDIDSSNIFLNELRHDEFQMRVHLGSKWYAHALWGYRQGENENWNSSRAKLSFIHKTNEVLSDVGIIHVMSNQENEMERFQVLGKTEFLQGYIRPFGNFDVRYTNVIEDSLYILKKQNENQILYGKTNTGFIFLKEKWNISEGVESKIAKRKGDIYGDEWSDSLKSMAWTQTVDYNSRNFDLNHYFQYTRRKLDSSDFEQSFAGNLSSRYENDSWGIITSTNYKIGLTEEQMYTSIYKAVASGTGDVKYDSITGTFIEGVDNGNFVYEGLGRNDSIGAIRASSALFNIDLEWTPSILFNIRRGILRDITLGGMFSASSEDTSSLNLYFPKLFSHELKKISSGMIQWEFRLNWNHPMGIFATYKPSTLYEKKLSSVSYFETNFDQNITIGYNIKETHYIESNIELENVKLESMQDLEWDTYEYSLFYRFSFMDGFFVEPGGSYRFGNGNDDAYYEFDAYLWDLSLRLGYSKGKNIDAYAKFSTIQMKSDEDIIPYQMMSGYSEGITYRLEVSASVDINDFLIFGINYVLRFGDAEKNTFQKLSTEARAYF